MAGWQDRSSVILPNRTIPCILLQQILHQQLQILTATEEFFQSEKWKLTWGMEKSHCRSRFLALAKISVFFLNAKWTSTFSAKLLSRLSLSSDGEMNISSFKSVSKSDVHLIIFWKSGSFDASVGTTWNQTSWVTNPSPTRTYFVGWDWRIHVSLHIISYSII